MIGVKICGLSTPETLEAAVQAGAEWVGFVHFPRSPRHLGWDTAGRLSHQARGRTKRVVLMVDPDDATIEAAVAAMHPDMIQLHGRETPDRVAAIRAATRLPVMKAIGIASADDLAAISDYAPVADRLLLDAKAPPGAALPGGNGVSFDWDLLAGADLPAGTILSGGLGPHNVAEAVTRTGIGAVDVSSGVESAPGVKDPALIAAFVAALRS